MFEVVCGCLWLFVVVCGCCWFGPLDNLRAQTCTFEVPKLQKHHQNSTRTPRERWEKRERIGAVPGRAVPGRAVRGRAVQGRTKERQKKERKKEKRKRRDFFLKENICTCPTLRGPTPSRPHPLSLPVFGKSRLKHWPNAVK